MVNFLKIKVLAFEVEEDNENDRKISFLAFDEEEI